MLRRIVHDAHHCNDRKVIKHTV
eukprot:SAG11_NODE_36920_length_259_cov_0.650000_1_plen_22_part_10